MALILNGAQKKVLVQLVLEAGLYLECHKINEAMCSSNLNFEITESEKALPDINRFEIQRQLISIIYTHISGKEFYELLKGACNTLGSDDRYAMALAQDKTYRKAFSSALDNAITEYHQHELQNNKIARKRALLETVLFCFLIIPIFFCKRFYNYRYTQYAKEPFFKGMIVDNEAFKSTDGASPKFISKKEKISQENTPLQEMVFNKKEISPESPSFREVKIRKCVKDLNKESLSKYTGFRFIGTKEQIEKKKGKLEGTRACSHGNNCSQ